MNEKQIKELFQYFDNSNTGSISYDAFIVKIKGSMNNRRKRLVIMAYDVMDKDGSGQVDILDFTADDAQLGKPAASDLASGTLTAPVIYAMEEFPALSGLIEREFNEAGDLEQALALVQQSRGIARSRELAEKFSHEAGACLDFLAPSEAKSALLHLPEFVLSRLY
jgi:hypothetical protein